MAKYYVSDEALKLKGKEYFEGLWLSEIKRHANEWVDGIYYSQDDMYDYFLSANKEDESFTQFDED